MFELSKVENWIYSVLAGGVADIDTAVKTGSGATSAWRIYSYQASSEKATYPLIIYNYQGGGDVQPLGVNRVMSLPLYQIKLISEGRPNEVARKATHAIDEIMGKASRQVHDGFAFSSRREQPIKYVENESGKSWYHTGGLYRVWVYQL